VKSRLIDKFLKRFADLPDAVKGLARKNYRLWKQNPAHPGLHFKKVDPKESLYSVRVGDGWRALGLLEGDTVTWIWIGSHADYDKLLS
jgi:hypothetical protein